MQALDNSENKSTNILKAVSFITAGSLFFAGFYVLLAYAIVDSNYARYMDSWNKFFYAVYIFEFCFSIIAIVLLSIEKLTQS